MLNHQGLKQPTGLRNPWLEGWSDERIIRAKRDEFRAMVSSGDKVPDRLATLYKAAELIARKYFITKNQPSKGMDTSIATQIVDLPAWCRLKAKKFRNYNKHPCDYEYIIAVKKLMKWGLQIQVPCFSSELQFIVKQSTDSFLDPMAKLKLVDGRLSDVLKTLKPPLINYDHWKSLGRVCERSLGDFIKMERAVGDDRYDPKNLQTSRAKGEAVA